MKRAKGRRVKKEIRLCKWCYQEYECHCGRQMAFHVWVDENDEKESFCDFCKESGFDSLYII